MIERSLDERQADLFADDYQDLAERAERRFLGYLFASHNGHLIPATRLLLHLDWEHFSGRGDLPVAVSFSCTAVSIALIFAILGIARSGDALPSRALGLFFAFWRFMIRFVIPPILIVALTMGITE